MNVVCTKIFRLERNDASKDVQKKQKFNTCNKKMVFQQKKAEKKVKTKFCNTYLCVCAEYKNKKKETKYSVYRCFDS